MNLHGTNIWVYMNEKDGSTTCVGWFSLVLHFDVTGVVLGRGLFSQISQRVFE